MIVDNIKNCEKYIGVNTKFEKAFNFIKKAVNENFEIGKYEIDGDVYAFVQEYMPKPEEECNFEGHRKYIDIQYIISGVEVIDVADISKFSPETEYDDEKDVQFFKTYENASKTVIESGEYGIFFPYDIHRPGMSVKNDIMIRKIVVKVKV